MVIIKLLLFVACVWNRSTAVDEFYSSTDQVMQLVKEERDLLRLFSGYIIAEEEHLKTLKGVLEILTELSFLNNPDETMNDPAAAYKLIKQIRIVWLSIVKSTQRSLYEDFQYLLHSKELKIPSLEDLKGAALGLISLQEMYKLYPVNITRGMPFTEDEAFYMGVVAYEQDKFQLAFHWFMYSLTRLNHPQSLDSIRSTTKEQLLEYLGSSAYRFGNLPVAIYFYKKLLNLDPTNEDVKYKLSLFRKLRLYRTSQPDILTLNTKSSNAHEALCRGEIKKMTSRKQRALSCRYSTGGGNPRLILAPLKEEIEWNEPRIIRYHDIISDEEIEILKNLSRPLLSRSKVGSHGAGMVSEGRLSQSVFLTEDDIVVVRVNQRIADATGLSMKTAEYLHVQNYGIGGKYDSHYDVGNNKNERIATFLIYMSDVEMGGATVFPKVGVALKPIKGSAVFWYNLHKNGDADLQTLHAGCPVLRGNKWVANKWIHEFGQEFIRPCSLSEWE